MKIAIWIFTYIIRPIFSMYTRIMRRVGEWCFGALERAGVGVGYLACFLLFAIGAACVLEKDLSFLSRFASFGLASVAIHVGGIFFLILAGFSFAHVVMVSAQIKAKEIAKEHEEIRKELNEAKGELEKSKSVNGELEERIKDKDGQIQDLEKVVKEKDVELQRSARTINLASVKKVLKLGLIEADMTIYDFDNDRENLVKSKVEVEGNLSIGHHRPRYLWQYIGFREDRLKVIFGVDLRDLHFELGTDGNDRVIIVHGVKPEHSFKEHRTLQSFAMKRKIYLKEAQQAEELSPEAKDAETKRCASMQVFEAFEGDKKKTWEVDEARPAEYTSSPNEVCKSVELQNNRIERIINGHKRDQFKALDDQVLEQVKEFLGVLLSPICDKIVIAIREDKPDQLEWTRIERLPGLEKFCEDFNSGRLLGAQASGGAIEG